VFYRGGLGAIATGALSVSSEAGSFSPTDLFASGEQGAWYDPSDLSTMFQDSTGVTPVTAVEQSVGKINDKSGNNNHATQATAAARPVLRARYNLLTYSEQFDNAAWAKTALGTVSAGTTVAPDGSSTAETITANGTSNQHYIGPNVVMPIANAVTMVLSVYVKKATADYCHILLTGANAYVQVRLTDGVVVFSSAGTCTEFAYAVAHAGSGWYRISVTGKQSTGSAVTFRIYPLAAANNTAGPSEASAASIYLWGAQVVTAADNATIGGEYQRIAADTVYDFDPTKFPPYLDFDGTDDSLATAAIDFSATDAMSAFAGVMKDSDAAQGVIVELTATTASNNGSFSIQAPDANAAATYLYESKGTVLANAQKGTAPAPNTAVLSGLSDISADTCTLRYNGAVAETDTGDQGTGNFANAVMYVARRGGTSLALNGRIYQLVVRGAASSAEEIANTEAYVADKTGVTLP
jgi:hypothetical protein